MPSTKTTNLVLRWGVAILCVLVYALVLTVSAQRSQAERDQQAIQSLKLLLQEKEKNQGERARVRAYAQVHAQQLDTQEGEKTANNDRGGAEDASYESGELETNEKEGGTAKGGAHDDASATKDKDEDMGTTFEKRFLSIANYTDAAAKYAAENPEEVAELIRGWAIGGNDVHKLQRPLHRTLDYLMVRDCEEKKHGKKGCIDGFVLPEQADKYFEWSAQHQSPAEEPTLCETGFNAGHSAATFLLSNRNLKMVSFDLFIQAYSASCYKYLKAVFGDDRVAVHKGDSAASLAKLAAKGSLKCDIVSVDGAHSFKACLKDVEGLGRLVARQGTPVLMDDTAEGFEMKGGPAEVWRKLVGESRLKQTKCVSLGVVKQWKRGSKAKPRGFCIGELNPELEKFDD